MSGKCNFVIFAFLLSVCSHSCQVYDNTQLLYDHKADDVSAYPFDHFIIYVIDITKYAPLYYPQDAYPLTVTYQKIVYSFEGIKSYYPCIVLN